jgi:hypothetical protein
LHVRICSQLFYFLFGGGFFSVTLSGSMLSGGFGKSAPNSSSNGASAFTFFSYLLFCGCFDFFAFAIMIFFSYQFIKAVIKLE